MSVADWSFSFDWRPGEHAEVTALLMREQFNSGAWRVLRWTALAVLVLATVIVAVSAAAGDWGSVASLGPLTALVGGLLLKFPFLTARLQAWRVARNDPNVGDPIHHTLTDQGLKIGMRTLDAELRWSGMQAVRETPTMFLFHYSKRMAYYLPKRAVGGGVEIEHLSEWIQRQLPAGTPYLQLESRS